MFFTLFLSLVLLGSSLTLMLRAIALPRAGAAAPVGRIQTYGFGEVAPQGDVAGPAVKNLDQTADRVGHWAARHLAGSFREDEVRAQLTMRRPLQRVARRVPRLSGDGRRRAPGRSGSTRSTRHVPLIARGSARSSRPLAGWILPMVQINRRAGCGASRSSTTCPS